MDEIYERAIECYVKKLENDNKKLRTLVKGIRSIIFDLDGANLDKSDIVDNIIALVRMYECDFKED